MITKLRNDLIILRKTKPLILCITNHVTMDFIANCLLSIGASPIMSESIDEINELTSISQAVYINIGTLNKEFIELAKHACIVAKQSNKPIIFDPVGVGASKIRTDATKEILPFVDIVRGNASEILAIFNNTQTLGIDASHEVSAASQAAKALARQYDIRVMVSGKNDFITDGIKNETINFGSKLMSLVTGMGCSLTAVISAFRAINPNSYQATISAANFFNLVGQITETVAKTPSSFEVKFIDNLYKPNWLKIGELYAKRK